MTADPWRGRALAMLAEASERVQSGELDAIGLVIVRRDPGDMVYRYFQISQGPEISADLMSTMLSEFAEVDLEQDGETILPLN